MLYLNRFQRNLLHVYTIRPGTPNIRPQGPHSLTVAPIPAPLTHTLPLHSPTPTTASAIPVNLNVPPSALRTASYPTPPNRHSTGSFGVSASPAGTVKRGASATRPTSSPR
jgi:hypothetical protein